MGRKALSINVRLARAEKLVAELKAEKEGKNNSQVVETKEVE